MLSTTLELFGFVAITAGAALAFGLAPALFVGGFSLLLVGQAAAGVKPLAALRGWLRAKRA